MSLARSFGLCWIWQGCSIRIAIISMHLKRTSSVCWVSERMKMSVWYRRVDRVCDCGYLMMVWGCGEKCLILLYRGLFENDQQGGLDVSFRFAVLVSLIIFRLVFLLIKHSMIVIVFLWVGVSGWVYRVWLSVASLTPRVVFMTFDGNDMRCIFSGWVYNLWRSVAFLALHYCHDIWLEGYVVYFLVMC